MTTIEKIEKGIITLAEFTEDQQSFIKGIVKLSFNEGQEQALLVREDVEFSHMLALSKVLKTPSIYNVGNEFELPKSGKVKFVAYNENVFVTKID